MLERRILSFTQTTVPHDLNRLKQHKENIILYHKDCNWTKLNIEQVNASRTVQQLKTHIQTVDELRHQLHPADEERFIALTRGVRVHVQRSIEEYGMVQSKILGGDTTEYSGNNDENFDQLTTVCDQSVLIPREEAAVQSWEDLRKDLLELNELTRALHTQVQEQRELVVKLETNIESAAIHVHHGEAKLQGGKQLKSYFFPVGGAIVGGFVGGIIAGPIGALAGLKVGALTAAAAGTAGAIGGAFVGYKAKEHDDQIVHNEEENKKER
ncbi:syntaxin-17-like isoform X2 [Halichondria panicea]